MQIGWQMKVNDKCIQMSSLSMFPKLLKITLKCFEKKDKTK